MKQLIAFLLVVLMSGGTLFGAVVQADNSVPVSVSDQEVVEARELLASVGVVPGFNTDLTEKVTRGDFVTALISLLKLNGASAAENCFYDVTVDSPCNIAVNHALNLGMVSEGMYFRPNDAVTFAEACKMLTVTLGYDSHAVSKGGYPYGYIAVASGLGLDDGIDTGANHELSSREAYILLANTLEADMLVMDSVVSDGEALFAGYGSVSNLMYIVHGLSKIEGVVEANSVTNIYDGADVCPDGFISIGGIKYKSDYQPDLGVRVTGYAEHKGQIWTVRYLTYDSNSIFTLYAGCDMTFDNGKITYTDSDGKEKKLSIDRDFSAVYNGKLFNGFTAEDINLDVGSVTLADSDSDGDYDVISIMEAEISYIDFVNSDTSVVVDSFLGVSYDLNDKDKYHVYSDGEKVSAGAVGKGSVLEVYTSKDELYVQINILTETVSGEVDEKGEGSFFIDSTEYKYTPYFVQRYMTNVGLGSSNTFVLTQCGKLAAATLAVEVSGMLGYAYKFANGTGIDDSYKIMIFTQDGNHVAYDVASKVRVDDSSLVTKDTLAQMFAEKGEGLIRFSANSEGCINSVIFPEEKASTTKDSIYVPGVDSKDTLKPYVIEGVSDTTSITYKIFGIFTPHFMISDETKIFCIDPSADKEEDKYTIGSMSTWANDSSLPLGAMEIYNVTSIGRADVLVVRHSIASSLGASRELLGGVIESVSEALDADGNEVLKIVLFNKAYRNLYIPKTHSKYVQASKELDYGDFIVYSADKNNNILDYDKDFDFSDGDIIHSSGGDNDGLSYYYGTLDEADEKAFSVELIDSSTATKKKMCVVVREDGGITSIGNVNRRVISGLAYSQLSTYKQQGYEVLVRTYCAEPFQIVVYQR